MSQRGAEAGRKPLKERTKLPDDALPGSVRHWIKVEALAIFHEGEFSAGEVAIMIGEDVKNVRNHIRELYEAGSIELAGYKKVGSYVRAVYRAIQLPVIEDEDACKMTVEERQYPQILNGSRKKRVAAGSGTSVAELNRLLKQYQQMRRLMRTARKGARGLDLSKLAFPGPRGQ